MYKKSLGNSERPRLILLHGWGLNGSVWEVFAEKLSQKYFVEMIDLPACGHSQSDWDSDIYTEQKLLPLLAEMIAENSMFIGWSLGGMLGLKLNQQYPEKIKKIVCLATNPCFVEHEGWREAMPENEFRGFVELFQKNSGQCLERFISLQAKGDESFKTVRRVLKNQMAVRQYHILEKGLKLLADLDCRESLKQIKTPVMHILGKHDQLVPVTVADYLQKLNGLCRIEIISSAGHAPFISQQEKCLSFINDFLAGV